jgi:hypothetical protein
MARKRRSSGKRKTGKKAITARQKSARRKNIAVARTARKKNSGKKLDPKKNRTLATGMLKRANRKGRGPSAKSLAIVDKAISAIGKQDKVRGKMRKLEKGIRSSQRKRNILRRKGRKGGLAGMTVSGVMKGERKMRAIEHGIRKMTRRRRGMAKDAGYTQRRRR